MISVRSSAVMLSVTCKCTQRQVLLNNALQCYELIHTVLPHDSRLFSLLHLCASPSLQKEVRRSPCLCKGTGEPDYFRMQMCTQPMRPQLTCIGRTLDRGVLPPERQHPLYEKYSVVSAYGPLGVVLTDAQICPLLLRV